MGHYRSEMGFEDEDRREAERKAAQKATIERNIKKQIDEHGVESVFADMIQALRDGRTYVTKWDYDRG